MRGLQGRLTQGQSPTSGSGPTGPPVWRSIPPDRRVALRVRRDEREPVLLQVGLLRAWRRPLRVRGVHGLQDGRPERSEQSKPATDGEREFLKHRSEPMNR